MASRRPGGENLRVRARVGATGGASEGAVGASTGATTGAAGVTVQLGGASRGAVEPPGAHDQASPSGVEEGVPGAGELLGPAEDIAPCAVRGVRDVALGASRAACGMQRSTSAAAT